MPLSKAKQAEWMREYRQRKYSVIPKPDTVIPKHPLGLLYPDGRTRLPDMSLVQPKHCLEVKLWER